jgi:hypothetical protein
MALIEHIEAELIELRDLVDHRTSTHTTNPQGARQ